MLLYFRGKTKFRNTYKTSLTADKEDWGWGFGTCDWINNPTDDWINNPTDDWINNATDDWTQHRFITFIT